MSNQTDFQHFLAQHLPRPQSQSQASTSQPLSPTHSTSNASAPGNATGTGNLQAQNLLNLLNYSSAASNSQQRPLEPTRQVSHSGSQASQSQPVFTAADLLARAASSRASRASPAPSVTYPAEASVPESSSTAQPSEPASQGIFTYKNPFEALRASRPHTPKAPGRPVDQQEFKNEPGDQPVQRTEAEAEASAGQAEAAITKPSSAKPKLEASPAINPATAGPQPETQQATRSIAIRQSSQTAVTAEPSHFAEQPQDISTFSTPAHVRPDPMDDTKAGSDSAGQDAANGDTSSSVIPVYSFPVKAFVSLTLELPYPATTKVREDAVMEICRLKKEFDQIDRSLAVASSKFIAYSLVRNGGMRVIRQEDGKDKHVFKYMQDRIFNVSLCTTSMTQPPGELQAVLGTAVSGAVYYATLAKSGHDYLDDDLLNSEKLIFPAHPAGDENTAGGVLKTRARRSSKHPEFFAIGRGKAISIIWPATVMAARYGITESNREVDMEQLLHERALQIHTGKAGKDFTFSEDDSTIVSLDKTGRLRFWDIRKLIDPENAHSIQIVPYIVKDPMLSLQTTSGTEKSWPTSVLFLDKARPYIKGGALRYVLVGLRQNHTLQLWDIALGKAVQEINFPHDNETDGICSVAYHSASGIIVVGHPTRNSIFFIHLSAPRYTLSSSLTQASFIQRVAAKDPDIPKPDSTACLSGVREISFEGRGQIRSVELLPTYKDASNPHQNTDALFELYIAHATGVTCLTVNRADLGWDAENKIINNVNAEKQGYLSQKELKLGSIIEETPQSKTSTAQESAAAPLNKKKKNKKGKEVLDEQVNGITEREVEIPADPAPTTVEGLFEQPNANQAKKDKKKKKAEPSPSHEEAKQPEMMTQSSIDAPSSQPTNAAITPDQVSMSISGDWLDKELKKIEKGVSTEFKKELDIMYHNIKTDRASQDQAAASRQEAVLRLVSDSLGKNVETSLAGIVRKQMEDVVVPSVVASVSDNLTKQLTQAVSTGVKKELSSDLPMQIDRALQSPHMLSRIAEAVSTRVATTIEAEVAKSIKASVATSMKSIATNTASEIMAASENKMTQQMATMQRQYAVFNDKLESLTGALQSVAQTLAGMSQAQVAFQNQVLEDRRAQMKEATTSSTQARSAGGVVQDHAPLATQPRSASSFSQSPASEVRATPAAQPERPSALELEVEEIASLMAARNYEEASIKWLQSSRNVELFDKLFSRYTPDYLASDVSPLVAFTIGVTVANSLNTFTAQRLEWIKVAFDTLDLRDPEIVDLAAHAPQLLASIIAKLHAIQGQEQQAGREGTVAAMASELIDKCNALTEHFQYVAA